MSREGILEYLRENEPIIVAIFGFIIFYKFDIFTNPAIKSFMFFGSGLIVFILLYLLTMNASKYSWLTILIFTPLLTILNLSFLLQIILDLGKPENIYSINLINNLFNPQNILIALFYLLIMLLGFLVLILIRKKC